MAKQLDDTKLDVQRKFLGYLPGMVDDYATLVRDSDNPKDKLEFISIASKLTGLEPKNDAHSGLATVNFVINMNRISAEALAEGVTATVEAEAVDVVSKEKPPAETILLPEDTAQPAAPEPALALEILPLDD